MRAPAASAAVLCVLLVVAGCSFKDPSGTPTSNDSSSTPTTSIAPEPTTPTEQLSATMTSSGSPSSVPLQDRLLPTGEVPGLNAQWHWQDGDTGQPTAEPFGVCAKADLLSIGASDVVARTYFPPDDSDDIAAEQIAEFPDAKTASTAWAVLKSWHDRCGQSLDASNGLKVRPMQPVPVDTGSARWYLLSWHPPGEETGRFEALGMVLAGTRIAVLKMDNSGQDHNYAPGDEPMVGMVRGASGWLR